MPLFLFLTGCSYEIKLSAVINEDCSVDVRFEDGNPQIKYILVAEAVDEKFNYKESIWEIDGNYKRIEKFSYGHLPEGFDQVIAPTPLVSGKNYFFVVQGSGGGFGAVKVEYKCLTNQSSNATSWLDSLQRASRTAAAV